jgi:hypothetical protein
MDRVDRLDHCPGNAGAPPMRGPEGRVPGFSTQSTGVPPGDQVMPVRSHQGDGKR